MAGDNLKLVLTDSDGTVLDSWDLENDAAIFEDLAKNEFLAGVTKQRLEIALADQTEGD